jgi:hypothetical protein
LGALLFSNETYRETLPVIDASGLPSFPFAYTSKQWLFDWRTGFVEESGMLISELTKTPLFKQEIDSYINFWNTEFAPQVSIGYRVRMKALLDYISPKLICI